MHNIRKIEVKQLRLFGQLDEVRTQKTVSKIRMLSTIRRPRCQRKIWNNEFMKKKGFI